MLTMLIIPLNFIAVNKSAGEVIRDAGEALRFQTLMSRWDYLFIQFRVIITYIRLLFFPINQNLDYNYPGYDSFLNPPIFLSFLFLLSILGLGIYLFYRSRVTMHDARYMIHDEQSTMHASRITHHALRFIAFGILWFFITLSIESSIIPIADVIFEHRLYLPSIGFIIALSTALFHILQWAISTTVRQNDNASEQSSSFSFLPIALPLYCSAALIVLLSFAAYQRNTIWKNEVSLWEDTVSKSPKNSRAHLNLGIGYRSKGLVDEAIEQYRIAVRLKPDCALSYYNLGNAFFDKGYFDRAVKQYKIAIRFKPDYAEAYNNLANAYVEIGWNDIAIEFYRTAIRFKPHCAEAYGNLANAYADKGWNDTAIEYYRAALRLNPGDKVARNNLNRILTFP
ncbi:MAG: tetratricopeptide repeat protein [Nitrospirae bacterium]|nr:tetratricopeptide repeat protein [Nitrospirota bacterium]